MSDESSFNHGNFQALLNFRVDAGDQLLKAFGDMQTKCKCTQVKKSRIKQDASIGRAWDPHAYGAWLSKLTE